MKRFLLPTALSLLISLLLTACSNPSDQTPATAKKTANQPFVPDDAAIQANNRGVGLMGRFEYAAAERVFAQLVSQYPDWLDAQVNHAIATLNRQQESDEATALAIVGHVLKVDPEHLRAHYVAGLLRLYLSAPDRALSHFHKVVKSDPKDAYAAYYFAQCLAQQGKAREAFVWYERAQALDPYLRSSYYGAFQALRHLERREEAKALIEDYQRLANNPRARLAEFKYTRMGPKAEALALGVAPKSRPPLPAGPVFAEGQALPLAEAETSPGQSQHSNRQASLTAADIDGDGRLDLFLADATAARQAHNLVLLATPDQRFRPALDHPLAQVGDVNAALWGDFDNDGQLDVYLLRRGPNQLWRQASPGHWIDVTASTMTAGGHRDTVGGAFFDADHDGDLDLFLVNSEGPNELLNNNRDGTFEPIAERQGIAGDGRGSRQVVPTDLDGDRDVDLVVINTCPPHQVYLNDRLWAYRPAPGFERLRESPVLAAIAGDGDADGRVELYTAGPGGQLLRWQADREARYQPELLASLPSHDPPWVGLAIHDTDGDGQLELISATPDGWSTRPLATPGEATPSFTAAMANGEALVGWAPLLREPDRGPAIVGLEASGGIRIWPPGAGRHPFLALALSGAHDPGQSMRSNTSGIGSRVGVRVGAHWSLVDNFLDHSGPGQGRQPLVVGLAGASQADFIAIDWSDGVFQSELDLAAGPLHAIAEVERQLSSCPVLFAWDGARYRFVTDLLGVGGIGYALGPPGEYATPRPWERLLLPEDLLQAKAGRLVLKITEPMEEIAYLDSVRLHAYDVPAGWQLAVDERMAILGPAPSGAAHTYRRELLPSRAVNDHHEVVTADLLQADGRAAPVGALDRRFIGRLIGEHRLTLEFPEALDRGPGAPLLVADGWVEYPYSQTMFAAWQAGARFEPPTLEARDPEGQWHILQEQFGYPAGMPRRLSYPLSGLPAGSRALRLRSNMEVYWDRIAVAFAEPLPERRDQILPLRRAEVRKIGFPQRTTGPQRRPHYDYERRRPFGDTRYLAGFYTRLGPVEELVGQTDGAYAIIGPGEEVHLEFAAPTAGPPPGWRRRVVLEANGWTKDMDLYTRDGETVAPLPSNNSPHSRRTALHARYQTRYQAGH